MKENPAESTRREYQKRLNQVINYIQANLEKKISVGELAGIANFSAFHFQHIFKAFTGYSLKNYINRLRLNSAAHRLLYKPELSVTGLALDYDFSCTSDFTRAFKKQFKMSPLQFRKKKKESLHETKANQPFFINKNRLDRQVVIRKMEELKLAYILCRGLAQNRKSEAIEQAYKRLYAWAAYKEYLTPETKIIGIYADNPEFTPLAECRFYACLSVPGQAEPEGEVGLFDWSLAGKYAVCRFNPRSLFFVHRFFKTTLYLYKCWLPDHGYLPDDKPMFELYELKNNQVRYLDFHIPIVTLK